MIDPELNDLKNIVVAQGSEIAALKAKLEQMEKADKSANRLGLTQMVAVVGAATAIVIATIMPRFEAVNQRLDSLEKRIEQSERNMGRRFEDFLKTQDKRFEDFKQEVRSLMQK
jgi:uncharacterized membrane protein YgaE (UPF0421/DUF939 family)